MIALLKGIVAEKSEGEAVLLCGGIGFRVMCSMTTLSALPGAGSEATLYTHLNVREDAMELYGFSSPDEKAMFRRLIGVSGIGARSALQVLGAMPLGDLRLAILTGDVGMLTRAPGIGKKTAQRIALELRDRVTQDALDAGDDAAVLAEDIEPAAQDALGEAMQALKSLGYSPQEAAHALKGVKGQAETADEMIRLALKRMAETK